MTAAVVVAAGFGERLRHLESYTIPTHTPAYTPTVDLNRPKALIPLCGKPLLCWVMNALESVALDAIVIVAHPNFLDEFQQLAGSENWRKVIAIVAGGKNRQQSVWAGLKSIPSQTEWVIVHDAARPLVTLSLVTSVLQAAKKTGAAITALQCVETVKRSLDGAFISETLDRTQIWLAQTPQAFSADILKSAHEKAISDNYMATDDAMLVERLNVPIQLVPGDPLNLKVTYPEDLFIAECYLRARLALS